MRDLNDNLADHIWRIGELVEAATGAVEAESPPGGPVGLSRVIDGEISCDSKFVEFGSNRSLKVS